ncbi:hypothetical protein D931_03817 [Enterococcus faecium 13.SD.W.09]|nr:hypothetical protein D931_03817 [Enterococcus faecium 13.SD.W.09]
MFPSAIKKVSNLYQYILLLQLIQDNIDETNKNYRSCTSITLV